MPHKRGKLFIISGPSGAGKGSVIQKAREIGPDIKTTISVTTRPKRPGEKDGVDYHFVTEEDFDDKVKKGYFVEWVELYGYKYGTPKDQVDDAVRTGENIFLEIDIQGAGEVKKLMPESVLIFIMPPSLEELEKRLKRRKTEKEETLTKRIRLAKEEIAAYDFYDYVIVNDKLDKAAKELADIISKESDG